MLLRRILLASVAIAFGCAEDPSPNNTTFGDGESGSESGTDSDSESASEDTGADTSSTTSDDSTTTTASTTGGAGDCGNGVIDAGEQCDGADLNSFDCSSLGYAGGTLGCDPMMCIFDTSMCTTDTGGSTSG